MSLFKDDFFFLGQIVLQPTTVCNLNCSYCYLPSRDKNLKMDSRLTVNLAQSLSDLSLEYNVPLIWHGGEPLAYGIDHFVKLIEPLEKLRKEGKISHCVQTNGTLIDDRWCEFFKNYGFEVGVSIDGPQLLNSNRVDWQGNDSFNKIMRGISLLRTHRINFTCIAVITNDALQEARDIYNFFCQIGCESVGINLEERMGTNLNSAHGEEVTTFWEELFKAWQENPQVRVREFTNILQWMGSLIGETEAIPNRTDIFPTIGWDGSVVLLSPEILGAQSLLYNNFVAGNLLKDDLSTILERGQKSRYIREYRQGVERCRSECKFFDYCRGGQASNKFFELGDITATETTHCRNSQQTPVEVVLKWL